MAHVRGRSGTSFELFSALLGALVLLIACAPAARADLAAGTYALNGAIRDVAHDPVTGDTYVAGSFTGAQAQTGSGLIVSSSGSGLPDPAAFPKVIGSISSVIDDGSGGWYIGGSFTHVGGLARSGLAHITAAGAVDPDWHPNVGPSTGLGLPATVRRIVRVGSTIYLAGIFGSVDGQARNGLAAVGTDGTLASWSPNIGAGVGFVQTIAALGTRLYVGASPGFLSVDRTTGAVEAIGSGYAVNALLAVGSTLYVAGDFTQIKGQARSGLAALDAAGDLTSWSPQLSGGVFAFAANSTRLYAAGIVSSVDGSPRPSGASFDLADGSLNSWQPGTSISYVSALAADDDRVLAISGMSSSGLHSFDAGDGSDLGWNPGPPSAAAVALQGAEAYVAGGSASAGPVLASLSGLARITADGALDTDWTPAESVGSPTALALDGSTLYIGGPSGVRSLVAATGATTGWAPAGGGGVTDIAVAGGTVYVAGDFSSIGGASRNDLAALSASTGLATPFDAQLPSGAGAAVVDIDVANGHLYAAGPYNTIGGQSRTRIAQLDASTGAATAWNPAPTVGGGSVSVGVVSATVHGVLVAGSFHSIGGATRGGVAALDPQTGLATPFDPAGSGLLQATAFAVTGSTIYVALNDAIVAFDAATGAAQPWRATLQGAMPASPFPTSQIRSLIVDGTALYAGGGAAFIGNAAGPFAKLDTTVSPSDPGTGAPGGGGSGGGGAAPVPSAPTIAAPLPPTPAPPTPAVVSVLASRLKGSGLAKASGATFSVSASGAGRFTGTVHSGKKRIGAASGRATAAGRTSVTVKLSTKARRGARKLRGKRLVVRLLFTPSSGSPVRRTVTLRVG